MGATITYVQPAIVDHQVISIEQYRIKRARRRKRVSRRMAIKYPLFAVEFMQDEFPNQTVEQFEADIKGKKFPKYKKGKSQLKRHGRYQPMMRAIAEYRYTKNPDFLFEAQRLRKKMFLPFEIVYKVEGRKLMIRLPSTENISFVLRLAKIEAETWDQLEKVVKEKLRYTRGAYFEI